MSSIQFINRLKTIDQLIRLQATGKPKELAEKLEVTERQVYNYINNLKELGAEIKYNREKNSYVYTSDIELVIAYMKKNK